MEKLATVRALPGFRLEVRFADGVSGVVSLEDRLYGPMFEPLRDPSLFARVALDEFGAPCWPNGADIAPDALYEQITASSAAPMGQQG